MHVGSDGSSGGDYRWSWSIVFFVVPAIYIKWTRILINTVNYKTKIFPKFVSSYWVIFGSYHILLRYYVQSGPLIELRTFSLSIFIFGKFYSAQTIRFLEPITYIFFFYSYRLFLRYYNFFKTFRFNI